MNQIEEDHIAKSQLRIVSTASNTRKRRHSLSADSEDNTSPYLPTQGEEISTQRRPGLREVKKHRRPDDAQFVSH